MVVPSKLNMIRSVNHYDRIRMKYRNYRRREQKRFAVAAAVVCWFILGLYLSAPFYLHRLPIYSEGETNTADPNIFNYSNTRTDVYELNGDVRIHGSSAAIFVASSRRDRLSWIYSLTIKPYPRKYDAAAMSTISAFKIMAAPIENLPPCALTFAAPAILFSTGAFAGNHFHSVADVLVPLFATAHRFNRDVVFLVTNHDSRLTKKHSVTLENLSRYEILDIDRANQTLCFPKVIVGLKAHRSDLSIDPSPSSNFSSRNFTKLLRTAYSLKRETVHDRRRPRLLIASRSRTRRLINELEVIGLAQKLGFDAAAENFGCNATSVAELVNTFDVMVGVHGAALTNMVFLPENAVVIQIKPVGVDNLAVCYEAGPPEMKLKYLDYNVSLTESSLLGKFPADSLVYRDPAKICKKGFEVCKDVYLDNQDVNLDLGRFRKTLLKALDLLTS